MEGGKEWKEEGVKGKGSGAGREWREKCNDGGSECL